jgi:hypothetical protein
MDSTLDPRELPYGPPHDHPAGQNVDLEVGQEGRLIDPDFQLEDDSPDDDDVRYSQGDGGSGVHNSLYQGHFMSQTYPTPPRLASHSYAEGRDAGGGVTYTHPSNNSNYSFNEASQPYSDAPASSTNLTYPSAGYLGEDQSAQFLADKLLLPSAPYVPQQVQRDLSRVGHESSAFHNSMGAGGTRMTRNHTEISSAGSCTDYNGSFNGSHAFDADTQVRYCGNSSPIVCIGGANT